MTRTGPSADDTSLWTRIRDDGTLVCFVVYTIYCGAALFAVLAAGVLANMQQLKHALLMQTTRQEAISKLINPLHGSAKDGDECKLIAAQNWELERIDKLAAVHASAFAKSEPVVKVLGVPISQGLVNVFSTLVVAVLTTVLKVVLESKYKV